MYLLQHIYSLKYSIITCNFAIFAQHLVDFLWCKYNKVFYPFYNPQFNTRKSFGYETTIMYILYIVKWHVTHHGLMRGSGFGSFAGWWLVGTKKAVIPARAANAELMEMIWL